MKDKKFLHPVNEKLFERMVETSKKTEIVNNKAIEQLLLETLFRCLGLRSDSFCGVELDYNKGDEFHRWLTYHLRNELKNFANKTWASCKDSVVKKVQKRQTSRSKLLYESWDEMATKRMDQVIRRVAEGFLQDQAKELARKDAQAIMERAFQKADEQLSKKT